MGKKHRGMWYRVQQANNKANQAVALATDNSNRITPMAETIEQLQTDFSNALVEIDGFTSEVATDLVVIAGQLEALGAARIAAGNANSMPLTIRNDGYGDCAAKPRYRFAGCRQKRRSGYPANRSSGRSQRFRVRIVCFPVWTINVAPPFRLWLASVPSVSLLCASPSVAPCRPVRSSRSCYASRWPVACDKRFYRPHRDEQAGLHL